MAQPLGRLLRVDARTVWHHEAQHFTPWLRDNVDRLNEALGTDIEIEAIEPGVGDFSADLRGKDSTSGRPVVIENQLGPTDHGHLGQVITYSAGLDAAIIIWIAPKFREEHRQAVDWLNQHTDETLDFFGVELELLRIDESLPAPHFKLVAQPNEWTKAARKTAAGEPGAPRERALRQKAFLERVLERAKQLRPELTTASRVAAQSYFYFSAGRSGFSFYWIFSGAGFGVETWIDTGDASRNKAFFDALRARKTEIEGRLGFGLHWERLDNRKASRVAVRRAGVSIDSDSATLDECVEWGALTMVRLADVLRPVLRELQPAVGPEPFASP